MRFGALCGMGCMTKSLSQYPRSLQGCVGKLQMDERQIILGFLFPAHQQATRAVGPRVDALDDPAAGLLARRVFRLGLTLRQGEKITLTIFSVVV